MQQPGRQDEWKEGGLYMTVLGFLPAYRTKRNKLDVRRLGNHPDFDRSPEAIYKMFRQDRLKRANANALIAIAAAADNAELLRQAGRQPPTLIDFVNFL